MTGAPRILRPGDWREQAWRNGGGVTHEIAAMRDGEALLWRLSTARVERDGAYSRFPGLVRISAAIEGAGIRLRDADTGARIDIPPLAPTVLDGDALYEGTLEDGPIRHLNLIFDPARVVADMRMLPPSGVAVAPGAEGTRLVFCIAGTVDMRGATLHARETWIGPAQHAPPRPAPGTAAIVATLRDLP